MLECRPDTAAGDNAMTVSTTGSIMTKNSMVTTTFNLKSRKDHLISGTYDISHYGGTVLQFWKNILFLLHAIIYLIPARSQYKNKEHNIITLKYTTYGV